MGSYVFLEVLYRHLPTLSQRDCLYSVDHMTRRVLLWFFLPGHWGISQSPHASSEELPHCLRSHPNLHLAGTPGERTGSLRHHGLLIHLQSKSKSRFWQNTDRKYPMAIKLLKSLRESLVFLYSLKKKINQEHQKTILIIYSPKHFSNYFF